MTEEQLTRLLKRVATATKDNKYLSTYATAVAASHANIGATSGNLILNFNKYRWALILSTGGAGTINWGFNSPNQGLNDGFVTNAASSSLLITYNDIGAAILGQLFAGGSSPGSVAAWQEFQVPLPLDGSGAFQL